MKSLHTQLLPKKSTTSARKISGYPPLISSWSHPSLMLRSEFLRWFLHEEREIPYQNQLQTSFFRKRVTMWLWFSKRQTIIKIVFRFWTKNYFEFCFSRSPLPRLVSSIIEIVATSIEAFSANCSKLFHSGKLVLNLILKDNRQDWFGFQMGYQPEKINSSIAPALPQSVFKSSTSILNA